MAKEKKKKPIYKRWWVWVIAIIVVISFLGGGDEEESGPKTVETSSNEESSNESNNNANEDKETEEEKTEFDVGEKVELDGQVVVVNKVEKSSGSDFDKPKDGKEFVIVHVSIENDGDKEISYNPFNFKMKNSNGQIEDQAFTTIDSDTSLSSGKLAQGGNVSGTISFEQPIDDPELQLIFEAGFWSGKEIIFNLQ